MLPWMNIEFVGCANYADMGHFWPIPIFTPQPGFLLSRRVLIRSHRDGTGMVVDGEKGQ